MRRSLVILQREALGAVNPWQLLRVTSLHGEDGGLLVRSSSIRGTRRLNRGSNLAILCGYRVVLA
jgi:hypothetical protein